MPEMVGRDSSVGIAIRYGFGLSGVEIPVQAKITAQFQDRP